MAALRSGAGLVRLAVPDVCVPTVAAFEPSYMTAGLESDPNGRIADSFHDVLDPLIEQSTAVACGPGMGVTSDTIELVAWLYRNVEQPLVVDADGLNALAKNPDILSSPGGPRILTPHPGEFGRLAGTDVSALAARREFAHELAARWGVVIVFKGSGTLITDGRQSSVNTTGNPGMATGGTGDVLTGSTTALLCQGLAPFEAARLAVHVHGLAGDLAAEELGQVSLIASDLLRFLPAAFKKLASE
jgi:NAD(P)H-hydrate epimerase